MAGTTAWKLMHGTECRAKAIVRTRVEPKTFFANERTFLQWLQISVLIMFMVRACAPPCHACQLPCSAIGGRSWLQVRAGRSAMSSAPCTSEAMTALVTVSQC